MKLIFVRFPFFERTAAHYRVTDEDVRRAEIDLIEDPERGDTIPGSGGARKMRIGFSGRGKRGGARVVYYYVGHTQKVYFLFVYPKNKQENLTGEQLAVIKQLVADLKDE